ncbi:DoxX family protein [Lentzea sp. HUAS12]|uniref:DoxX family protein n=1 Tax=Lentzea sp. HUAS12 TaxID=2951806 RepID=UPI00209F8629|nr:DoxX family protein [Lentzea sp. HUAS12]USX53652.1 DoxX family protein [Lentzea sp. HUAS12]
MLEVLAALGLVLPAVTSIAPVFVPLVAAGLVVTMIGAMFGHARRREFACLGLNALLLVLSAVGARGHQLDQVPNAAMAASIRAAPVGARSMVAR